MIFRNTTDCAPSTKTPRWVTASPVPSVNPPAASPLTVISYRCRASSTSIRVTGVPVIAAAAPYAHGRGADTLLPPVKRSTVAPPLRETQNALNVLGPDPSVRP